MTTVAFVGNGPISENNVFTLLNDLFGITGEYPDGHENEGFPIWPSEERPNLVYVHTEPLVLESGFYNAWLYAEYAVLQYTALVDSQIKDDPSLTDSIDYAAETLLAVDIPEAVVTLLSRDKEEGTALIVLTDNGKVDVHVQDVINACNVRGIPVLELTAGLDFLNSVQTDTTVAVEPVVEAQTISEDSPDQEELVEGTDKSSDEAQQVDPKFVFLGEPSVNELEMLAQRLLPYLTKAFEAQNKTRGKPRT